MKAARLLSAGEFAVVDIPVPEPGEGEFLVEVVGAGMCGTDVHISAQPPPGYDPPFTLGHETAGRIAQLGPGASGFEVGDAVLVLGIWACGVCPPCTAGLVNRCHYWTLHPPAKGAGLGFDGGMADYVKAPVRGLFGIGDLDPLQAAPLADAGLTAMGAVNMVRSHLTPDATVAVLGVGGLGHMALQALRATTGCRIVALDTDPRRLETATGLGADVTMVSDGEAAGKLRELTGGLGVDVVLDFVGIGPTMSLASEVTAKFGAICVVGLGGGTLPVLAAPAPIGHPAYGVQVMRPFGGTLVDLNQVVSLAASGQLTAHVEQFALEQAPDVLGKLAAGEVEGRAVLVP